MIVYCYPKCSTCQKAIKWLDENKITYQLKNIKDDHPTADQFDVYCQKFNIPIRKLFNTSGLVYKELNLKEKLPVLTQKEQLSLLASDGMLIKRPLIIADSFILVGFKLEEYQEKLLVK